MRYTLTGLAVLLQPSLNLVRPGDILYMHSLLHIT